MGVQLLQLLREFRLSSAAKVELRRDRQGQPPEDPGIDLVIPEAAAWLARAQDCSASQDGGIARHYSLITGWGSSYPEATGYVIPTMLECADFLNEPGLRKRAARMLNWLVSIQLPSGSFQGGTIDAKPVIPVAFNTAQAVAGLAAGARVFGNRYKPALVRAAEWLLKTQEPDGSWRRHPTPFAVAGEKAYECYVACGLLAAFEVTGNRSYLDAALATVDWALQSQAENGWFRNCCLTDREQPLTHTLGYALRGILEVGRYARAPELIRKAQKTADGLLSTMRPDGFIPGRLSSDWRVAVSWACLTGTTQIASCWFLLHEITGDPRYKEGGLAGNRYVRKTISLDGSADSRGGIKGSFPIDGDYNRFQYLSWACKFFLDSNIEEWRLARR